MSTSAQPFSIAWRKVLTTICELNHVAEEKNENWPALQVAACIGAVPAVLLFWMWPFDGLSPDAAFSQIVWMGAILTGSIVGWINNTLFRWSMYVAWFGILAAAAQVIIAVMPVVQYIGGILTPVAAVITGLIIVVFESLRSVLADIRTWAIVMVVLLALILGQLSQLNARRW